MIHEEWVQRDEIDSTNEKEKKNYTQPEREEENLI